MKTRLLLPLTLAAVCSSAFADQTTPLNAQENQMPQLQAEQQIIETTENQNPNAIIESQENIDSRQVLKQEIEAHNQNQEQQKDTYKAKVIDEKDQAQQKIDITPETQTQNQIETPLNEQAENSPEDAKEALALNQSEKKWWQFWR